MSFSPHNLCATIKLVLKYLISKSHWWVDACLNDLHSGMKVAHIDSMFRYSLIIIIAGLLPNLYSFNSELLPVLSSVLPDLGLPSLSSLAWQSCLSVLHFSQVWCLFSPPHSFCMVVILLPPPPGSKSRKFQNPASVCTS